LQDFLHAVAAGEAIVPVHRVYHLDEIREAHAEMEAGSATGKIVVLTQPAADQSRSSREEQS
jgi:NADPH2:quinone reductase